MPSKPTAAPSSVSVLTVLLVQLIFWPTSSWATSHWVVTPQGRIQAQMNSVYHLSRPHDLVALLEQEGRVRTLESLKLSLAHQHLDVLQEMHSIQPDLSYFKANPDCQSTDLSLPDWDMYVSTIILPHSDEQPRSFTPPDGHPEEPICDQPHVDLGSLDQLEGMKNRDQLQLPPETDLEAVILKDKMPLQDYGHMVAKAIKAMAPTQLPSSWRIWLQASSYWRMKGLAHAAVECARLALWQAPEQQKPLPMLALANILHRSHYSHDAKVVLEQAIQLNPSHHLLHFTLGNVYATLLAFNQSAFSFERTLQLEPSFEEARHRLNAVLCHFHLEKLLESQHHSLKLTLRELRRYKKQHEEWKSILAKLLDAQASETVRLESLLEYENLRILKSMNGVGQDCQRTTINGTPMLKCSLRDNVMLPFTVAEVGHSGGSDQSNDIWIHP